jgi:DNA modification methylase
MNQIEFGDCRDTMRRWAGEGVKAQMCVTSPPYFGLRDYGHEGQIGLEQTPEQYIAAMVEVFRCVRDVLADDGTLWLNIGDSYNGSGGNHKPHHKNDSGFQGKIGADSYQGRGNKIDGLKPKDLIGIPWMLAFALRADGWYLRQDIIWHKPNPMPESVRDRCTKAHEYIFLLSKSDRYFFDSEAMKEPGVIPAGTRAAKGSAERQAQSGVNARPPEYKVYDGMRNKRSVWTVQTRPYKGAHFATFPPALIEPCILAGSRPGDIVLDPFMGSGTTAQVALQHDRKYLGCELNPEYGSLQQERINQVTKEESNQLSLDWAMDQQPRGKNSLNTPPAAQQEPLTDQAVTAVYKKMAQESRMSAFTAENWFQAGVAVAEAAHGIGDKK